jgi:hypothetical protein
MDAAGSILCSIRSLGYHVSVHRMAGGISLSGNPLPVPDRYIERHAHTDDDPPINHIARIDDDGPEAEYKCACELALQVGIDLPDR